MFFRIILKLYLEFFIQFYSILARIKLRALGKVGCKLRAEGPLLLSSIAGHLEIGHNVTLGPNVRIGIAKGAKLIIGNNVSINQGTFIIAVCEINISNDCRIGEYCSVRDNDHKWNDLLTPVRLQGFTSAPVFIGTDVWLGRGVTISKGVNIGEKSIIGASSVVTKSIPRCQIWAGVPARKIKCRKE